MNKVLSNPETIMNDKEVNIEEKIGIVIVSSGTPDAPDLTAVRRFLLEFMSDPRVTRINPVIWLPILHLFILRKRAPILTEKYQAIWTEDGSPLKVYMERFVQKLEANLASELGKPFILKFGMRYGIPSLDNVLEKLYIEGTRHFLVLPEFPQYSTVTVASIQDVINKWSRTKQTHPEIELIHSYYRNDSYLNAIVKNIQHYWETNGQAERLLFSFHGVPKSFVGSGCPYLEQCQETAEIIARRLSLLNDQWELSFQSRFGNREWLRPYTDELLEDWISSGVKTVDIVTPGFSFDSLETLYEINIELREKFSQAGGGQFGYIPALNDSEEHVKAMTHLILESCSYLNQP